MSRQACLGVSDVGGREHGDGGVTLPVARAPTNGAAPDAKVGARPKEASLALLSAHGAGHFERALVDSKIQGERFPSVVYTGMWLACACVVALPNSESCRNEAVISKMTNVRHS